MRMPLRPVPHCCAVIALTVLLACISSGNAAILLQWNTFGNAGTETTEPSVFNDPGLTSSNLTLGAGVTAAANGNRFGGNAWFDTGDTNPTTLAESVSGNDYIQFIVTPTAGTASFTVTTLTFSWERSSTGPNSVTLRSSLDSFTADLGTVSPLPSPGVSTGNTISFSVTSSSAVTFRLYGYGATAAAGTGGFDTAVNAVNVQLDGTVTPVPEPATIFGGLLGLGGLGWHQRRRFMRLIAARD